MFRPTTHDGHKKVIIHWYDSIMIKRIQKTIFALGTVNTVSLTGTEDLAAARMATERVRELDERLSVFKAASDISKINAAAGKGYVTVHQDTLHIIKAALYYSQLSQGAFDITMRPLTKLWDIGIKGFFVPSDAEIAEARGFVDYRDIIINEAEAAVKLKRTGQAIDLGGIAKGYAADEVGRILKENGVRDALINLGGTVKVIGPPRTVGLQHPALPTGRPMGKLMIENQAVVTSGSNEKSFIKEGVRYHHILDPRSGSPAEAGLLSVTLIGGSCTELDALSTAVFVLGIREGNRILENRGIEAVYVTKALEILLSPGIKDRFKLLNE